MTERTDLELIDHFRDRDPPERHRDIEAELAESPETKRCYDELAAVWNLLGEASTPLPQRDLWPDIAHRLASRRIVPAPWARLPWWSRAAAAVVMAAAIGWGTARLRLGSSDTGTIAATVTEAEVTEQLRLSSLAGGTVRQFGDSILGSEPVGSN